MAPGCLSLHKPNAPTLISPTYCDLHNRWDRAVRWTSLKQNEIDLVHVKLIYNTYFSW